jgi:hypothetical protein
VKVFIVAVAVAAIVALAAAYTLSNYVQETSATAYSATGVRIQ